MHPLIPFPSAPGQLSLAQVHQALFLIGQLLKREFQIFSTDVSAMSSKTKVANAFNSAFLELGYPYRCTTYVALTGSKGLGFEIQSQESADSLLERICQQFSLWTGRPAQVSVITDALSGTPDSGPQGL
jgi:hypothetical protein